MEKYHAVIFHRFNAIERFGCTSEEIAQWNTFAPVVVNPKTADLPKDRHFWKLSSDHKKILPMTKEEQKNRMLEIQAYEKEYGPISNLLSPDNPLFSDGVQRRLKLRHQEILVKSGKILGTMGGGAALLALIERMWG